MAYTEYPYIPKEYKRKIWDNVPDPNNYEGSYNLNTLPRYDAANMNRIEDGIEMHIADKIAHNKSTEGGAFGIDAEATSGGAVGESAKASSGGAIGYKASTTTGAAVGSQAETTNGGAALGSSASATTGGAVGVKAKETGGGGAVGNGAVANLGGAVGALATTKNGFAGGNGATTKEGAGGAVGAEAIATTGGAVGAFAINGSGFSGGLNAKAIDSLGNEIDAIQLGTGTNNNPKSLQIYGYQLMKADGTIPSGRIKTLNVSVPNSWSTNSSGGYMQTVHVGGILETDNPVVDIVLGTDVEANKLYTKAWGCVDRITTSDGSITLYAYDNKPEIAFNIKLKVV